MYSLGKVLILLGLTLIVIGAGVSLAGKVSWIGRLPGDISIKRQYFSFYFPLTTCIIASVAVSLLFYLFRR